MSGKKNTNGNTSSNENTENPEFKIASEVLSKAEVKPEVKPESKPEVGNNLTVPINGNVIIEAKPIGLGELESVRIEELKEKLKDRKKELIMQVLRNVVDDLYNWLNTKGEATLKRYASADTTDILIDYITEISDELYRRLSRFRLVSEKINRLIGGGSARPFTQRDLERMIFERLAGSIAGTMEASIEQTRRRRIADEIIRELMESKEQNSEQGGNK